jgi:hypothetical protein
VGVRGCGGLTKLILDPQLSRSPWYAKPLFDNVFNPLTGGLLYLFAECCTYESNVNMFEKATGWVSRSICSKAMLHLWRRTSEL